MQIAILGTGTMGAGMARALLSRDFNVRVWNRTSAKSQPLADDGAQVATTPAEAVTGADVIITMLFDADAVDEVMESVATDVPDRAIWLQSSTVGVEGLERLAALSREHSLDMLDAPMLGTKQPAEEGALVVLASGDPALRTRVQPVFDAIGTKTVWAGEALGDASRLKLVCNAWITTLTAAVGQSIALADGLGLHPQLFLDAIAGGAADTPHAHVKGKQMIAGDYPASFALDGALKDLHLIASAATDAGIDSTITSAVREVFTRASESGHGGDDFAAVYAGLHAAR